MKKKTKLFCIGALLVLMIPMIPLLYVGDARAVPGQTYSGDGATNNPTVPPGGWLTSGAFDGSCFTCHYTGNTVSAPDMTSYLMTGHKNMLRVDQQGFALTGPDGNGYTTDLFGNVFNWAGSSINITGFCTNSAYVEPLSCGAGGGIWISGPKDLYYIFGGWTGAPAVPGALFDGSYIQGTQQTAVSYSCGRCHTTGFTLDNAIRPPVQTFCTVPFSCSTTTLLACTTNSDCPSGQTCKANNTPPKCTGAGGQWTTACRSPEYYFTGITWTPANTSGIINFDPDGNGPAVSSSWAVNCGTSESLEGVECERCHNASSHPAGAATRPRGADSTALCLECHRQEHTLSYTSGGLGANIKPTPFSDDSRVCSIHTNLICVTNSNCPSGETCRANLPTSEPVYPLPSIEVGTDSGYAPQFYKYSTGMEFLNSPHARFGGNFQQIATPAQYSSSFSETIGSCSNPLHVIQTTCTSGGGVWSTGTVQGGCTTCHEVHQSTVPAVSAPLPYKNSCGISCHAEKASWVSPFPNAFNHPTGEGTPVEDTAANKAQKACVVCHMWSLPITDGENLPGHLWRINSDPSYSTWPTVTAYNTGTHIASSQTDGGYTNAVWVDVNAVCGQCHGGGDTRVSTTGDATAGSAVVTVASTAGINIGDIIVVEGAEARIGYGAYPDVRAAVIGISGNQLTLASKITNAVTGAVVRKNAAAGTTVPYFTKAQAAAAAVSIHETDVSGTNCSACHNGTDYKTFVHPTSEPSLYEQLNGIGLQGIPSNCTYCHTAPFHKQILPTAAGTCGTCHGVSGAAHLFTSGDWSTMAADQHALGASSPNATCGAACHTSMASAANYHHPTGAGTPGVPGTGTCETCHQNTRRGVVPTTTDACNACHGTSGAAKHFFSMTSPAFMGLAGTMHTTGVTTYSTTCTDCHDERISFMDHPQVAMLSSCDQCHAVPGASRPGVLPLNVDTTCGTCHGGGTNPIDNPPSNGVFWRSHNDLTARANGIHRAGVDLVILSFSGPNNAKRGSTFTVYDATKNRWGSHAGPSTTAVYLSSDTTLDNADVLVGSRSVPTLAGAADSSGSISSGSISVTIPALTPAGNYYLIWKADKGTTATDNGVITEINETNNTKYKAIRITN